MRHIAEAARLYEQALDMMPATAVTEQGTIHNQLGNIYDDAGDIDRALHHYRQSIHNADKAGETFVAGTRRSNVAITLLQVGRLNDARAFAEAALANLLSFDDRAADVIQKTEGIIATIDQAIAREARGA